MSQKNIDLSADKPTAFAHPGMRAAYTLVAWLILGITMSAGNSTFVGLIMLSCGLLFDYAKFSPRTKFRSFTKGVGIFIASIILIVNLVSAFGAMVIVENGGVFSIEVVSFPYFQGEQFAASGYWVLSAVAIFWTVMDWVSEIREIEAPKPTYTENTSGVVVGSETH